MTLCTTPLFCATTPYIEKQLSFSPTSKRANRTNLRNVLNHNGKRCSPTVISYFSHASVRAPEFFFAQST